MTNVILLADAGITQTAGTVTSGGGLTVYGAKIEASVDPSSIHTHIMRVQDTADYPMDITVGVKGYGMSAHRDFMALEPWNDKSPYTARELLVADPTSFHLEPGDSREVTVVARIPSTGKGGRYAIVLIKTNPRKADGYYVVLAVAARVLLTISGFSRDTSSEIAQVSKAWEPAGLLITVASKGNYHYKPQIQAKLKDGTETVATASIVHEWPIIPGYSRQFNLGFTSQELLAADRAEIEVKDESGKLIVEGIHFISTIEGWLPMLPWEGPPLPKWMGIYWPGFKIIENGFTGV